MDSAQDTPISEFLSLLGDRQAEIQGFDRYLAEHTTWLTAPASTRFHLPQEGGLVEHSRNVVETMLKLRDTLAPDVSVESCVLVGLYHDVGKVGMPGRPYYLLNEEEAASSVNRPRYRVNKDLVHMDIATRSLFLVSQHVALSDEEAQAIRYHDGQYIDENQSVAHRECRLTRLVQYADNWSGGVLEERGGS